MTSQHVIFQMLQVIGCNTLTLAQGVRARHHFPGVNGGEMVRHVFPENLVAGKAPCAILVLLKFIPKAEYTLQLGALERKVLPGRFFRGQDCVAHQRRTAARRRFARHVHATTEVSHGLHTDDPLVLHGLRPHVFFDVRETRQVCSLRYGVNGRLLLAADEEALVTAVELSLDQCITLEDEVLLTSARLQLRPVQRLSGAIILLHLPTLDGQNIVFRRLREGAIFRLDGFGELLII